MKKLKKILGIIAGILVLTILGVYLFRNTIIEYFGEKIGSQEYGAKIDIDDVALDIFGGRLKIGRVQITDKNNTMRNIGDIQKINLELEYKPILEKLIVVNDASLGLIEIFTPREVDGAIVNKKIVSPLKGPSNSKGINVKKEKKLNLSNLDLDINSDNYKKVLDDLNIKIIEEYNLEKEKVEQIYVYWEKKLNGESYKDKLKNIEINYKILEEKVKNEKDPLKLLNEVDKLNNLINEIDGLVKEAENDKKKFDNDIETIKNIQKKAFKYIDSSDPFKDMIGWDEEQLKSEINLVLNEHLEEYVEKNIDFFNKIDKKEEKSKEKAFDIWVKNTNLTFKYLNYTVKGRGKDITSRVGITPNPIEFKLDIDDKIVKGNIQGEFNRKLETAKIKSNLSGLIIDDKMIGENKTLIIIVGSKMNLSYNMNYENKIINLDGRVVIDNLKINSDELKIDKNVLEVLGKSLQKIEKLIINYNYNGSTEKLEFDTNIGAILSSVIKEVLDENIKVYKAKAKTMLDEEMKKYAKKLNLEVEKVESLKELIEINPKDLKSLEKETKSNKDSKSTRNLIDGLGDGLKNLFN